MIDNLLSRAFRVGEPRMAAAFSDPLRRRLVLLLAGEARSLSELAGVVGVELKRLHYHVGALQALGLIVVAGSRPRAGRPVKLYRAVANAFFVPAEAMAAPPSAALAAELRAAQARLADPSHEGVLYHLNPAGEPRMQPVASPRARPAPTAETWRLLRLSPTEALRLAADLEACLKAAADRSRGSTETYLVHFAFAPRGAQ